MKECLFYPGIKTLKNCVADNLLANCAITADDINRDKFIYGPPEPYLQGHIIRSKHPTHDKVDKILLPPMMSLHRLKVSFHIFFFFVNGNMFSTQNLKVLISLLPDTALTSHSRL